MLKSFKNIALAGAAMTLAITPAMAGAQEQPVPDTDEQTETANPNVPQTEPDSTVTADAAPMPGTTTPPTNPDSVPADATTTPTPDAAADAATPTMTVAQQQAAIQTWPQETQVYYQSLSEERQRMFWALSDTDKVRLSNLPDEQRELAWNQIEAQVTKAQG